MFKKFVSLCVGVLLIAGCSLSASTTKATTTKATATKAVTSKTAATNPAQSEAIAFSRKLGLGTNLGNTLEATGDWIAATRGNTVTAHETAWGAPVTTKAMFDGF